MLAVPLASYGLTADIAQDMLADVGCSFDQQWADRWS
jgi:hypothetical protein